jgi:hypothetical protein
MSPSTSMAKIYVGEEKMWYVHEAIICVKSDYFSKALQEGFKEAQQKEIYLEEVDTDAFSLFMDCVYGNGRFFQYMKRTDKDIRTRAARTDVEKEAFIYVKLYHLANYLGIGFLENLTMDVVVSHYYCREHKPRPQPKIVQYVYDCCPSDSPLHTFLVMATAHEVLNFNTFGRASYREAVLLCPQFGVDVLDKINRLDGSRIPNPALGRLQLVHS